MSCGDGIKSPLEHLESRRECVNDRVAKHASLQERGH